MRAPSAPPSLPVIVIVIHSIIIIVFGKDSWHSVSVFYETRLRASYELYRCCHLAPTTEESAPQMPLHVPVLAPSDAAPGLRHRIRGPGGADGPAPPLSREGRGFRQDGLWCRAARALRSPHRKVHGGQRRCALLPDRPACKASCLQLGPSLPPRTPGAARLR